VGRQKRGWWGVLISVSVQCAAWRLAAELVPLQGSGPRERVRRDLILSSGKGQASGSVECVSVDTGVEGVEGVEGVSTAILTSGML